MSNALSMEYPDGLSPINIAVKFDFQHYFKIKDLTIAPNFSIGANSHKPFLTERFIIGGLEFTNRLNEISMSGVQQGHILTNGYAKAGLTFQYVFFKNIFLQTGTDGLIFFDKLNTALPENFDDFFLLAAWHVGLGVTTPIGPLKLSYSRLIGFNEDAWTLNAGFPF
jgi:hypothetical protein